MSFTLIGTALTKDIILSSISTTISTTTSIIKFLLCQKESELDVFKRELFKSDLCNNLLYILEGLNFICFFILSNLCVVIPNIICFYFNIYKYINT